MAHRIELRTRADQYFVYGGRSLLVTDLDGWVTGRGIEGFYVEETRLLSRDEVTVGGRPLKLVAASPVGGDGFLAYAVVPRLPSVRGQAVYVTAARRVGEGMREELKIENYHAREAARFDLAIHL